MSSNECKHIISSEEELKCGLTKNRITYVKQLDRLVNRVEKGNLRSVICGENVGEMFENWIERVMQNDPELLSRTSILRKMEIIKNGVRKM